MTRALITGGSGGIGAAFAAQLAKRGTDLVLVARGQAALSTLAYELSTEHSVSVEIVTADLTDPAALQEVEAMLSDPTSEIDLLVNNAGYGSYGEFAELGVDSEAGQVDLNIKALIRLTHASLEPMLAARSGSIINISSTAGAQPMPYSAVYAASKAFVTSFTHALVEETKGSGVHVMAVLPGFTKTEFHERAHVKSASIPAGIWMRADQVAKTALRDLDRKKHICVPGTFNRLGVAGAELSPPTLTRKVGSVIAKRFG